MSGITTHNNYMELCQRIREKCQRQRWYGGDEENTARFHEADLRYEILYTPDGKEKVIDRDPDDHPRKTSFAYSPATEQQLAQTEQSLGLSLPPFLRSLYTQVANGGFGPGYGLMGAIGGFSEAGDIVDNSLFYSKRAMLIDLDDYEESILAGETLELSETVWPYALLLFCDWGWGAASCVDCRSGRVFLTRPGKQNLHYRLELQAQSLEDWWEMWLQGTLRYERELLPGEERFFDPAKVQEVLNEVPQFDRIRPLLKAWFESLIENEEENRE